VSAFGWLLFAACNMVCVALGWILRGWRYEVAEYRAEEEAERVADGRTQDDGDRELW
jgi:hypothetical protein